MLTYLVLISPIKWDRYFHFHITDKEFNTQELHGPRIRTRPSKLHFLYFMMFYWWLVGLGEIVSPRASKFLEIPKGSGIPKGLSFIGKPTKPESIGPTTSLPNSHTPSQYFFCLKPRGRYQVTRDQTYSPKPEGIIQTSQS